MKATHLRIAPNRSGFTLVEVLVVVVIIGILAALLLPAVTSAVRRARNAAIRMEVDSLSQAIEAYNLKYGDYPPDFSDWSLVTRHYRKIFPRINGSELLYLGTLTAQGSAVDRAEALVFALGGFSADAEYPFSGPGGPLFVTVDNGNTIASYNTERANALFDFEIKTLSLANSSPIVDTIDGDVFPDYRQDKESAPIVYFDSRTYFQPVDTDANGSFDDYNGYSHASGTITDRFGIRPYLSNEPSTTGVPKFANSHTFQILSPGIDGVFGTYFRSSLSGTTRTAYYFVFPTGAMLQTAKDFSDSSAPAITLVAGSNGYQESSYDPLGYGVSDNFQLDNVTNFAPGPLSGSIEE